MEAVAPVPESRHAHTQEPPFEASFKPAPARSAVAWTLDGTVVKRNGASVLRLENVVSGAHFSFFHRRTGHRKFLLLVDNGGAEVKMEFGSLGPNDGMRQYTLMVVRIALALAAVNTTARLNVGGGFKNMLGWFVSGIMFLALGLGCGFAAFSIDETAGFLILGAMSLMFVGLGGLLCYGFYPWNIARFDRSPQEFLDGILNKRIEI